MVCATPSSTRRTEVGPKNCSDSSHPSAQSLPPVAVGQAFVHLNPTGRLAFLAEWQHTGLGSVFQAKQTAKGNLHFTLRGKSRVFCLNSVHVLAGNVRVCSSGSVEGALSVQLAAPAPLEFRDPQSSRR